MSSTIRCAIIGLGPNTPGKGGAHSISYCHAWAFQATAGMQLVAGCSRNEKNVQDFVAEFPGTEGFQNYRQMLQKAKPDLVSVCAYAQDREEMVNACLDAGVRAVWIEKPFALSLAAARRMLERATAAGARLFVNHQRRYGKPFELFQAAAGKIGAVLGVDIVQPFPNFLDFGPHLVDAAFYALGEGRTLQSLIAAVDWSEDRIWQGLAVEKQILASAHFQDGTRLCIEVGKEVPAAFPILRLNGSLGFAELHLNPAADAGCVYRARLAGESEIHSPVTDEHFHHSADPALYMKRAAADVTQALQTGGRTRIEATEALRGLEVILGIYESARRSKLLTAPVQNWP